MSTLAIAVPDKTDSVLATEAALPPSYEERALSLARSTVIDPRRPETIVTIGADVQRQSTAISTTLLQHVQNKDVGDSGKLLTELMVHCKAIDPTKLGHSRLDQITHKLHLDKAVSFLGGYQNTLHALDDIKLKLQAAHDTVMQDSISLGTLYDQNLALYRDTKLWIRVCQLKKAELEKQIAAAPGVGDLTADVDSTEDLRSSLARLDKHMYDLELTATLRLQAAPKIRITQAGDLELAEMLQSSVVNTMSLWKDNLALLVAQVRQKENLEIENSVRDGTNAMLKQSADLMHANMTGVAKVSERGVVDIETVEYSQKQLIATLDEVAKIHADGAKARDDARTKLSAMEAEMKAKLSK